MSQEPGLEFFVSYARVEFDLMAANVRSALDRNAFSYWIDERMSETIGSDDWWREIVRQITEAHSFVFLFTEHWQQSEICRREYHTALSLRKTMIPVQIDDFDVASDLRYLPQKYQVSRLFEKHGRSLFEQRIRTASQNHALSLVIDVEDSKIPTERFLEGIKERWA